MAERAGGAAGPAAPALAVVKGQASPDEVAALTAVLATAAARVRAAAVGGGVPGPQPVGAAAGGGWADRARLVRAPLQPGRGAWRRSALPR